MLLVLSFCYCLHSFLIISHDLNKFHILRLYCLDSLPESWRCESRSVRLTMRDMSYKNPWDSRSYPRSCNSLFAMCLYWTSLAKMSATDLLELSVKPSIERRVVRILYDCRCLVALYFIGADKDKLQAAMTEKGAVSPVVRLCRSSEVEIQAEAADVVKVLARNTKAASLIVACGE